MFCIWGASVPLQVVNNSPEYPGSNLWHKAGVVPKHVCDPKSTPKEEKWNQKVSGFDKLLYVPGNQEGDGARDIILWER